MMSSPRLLAALLSLLACFVAAACTPGEASQERAPEVVATTTMLADLARQLSGGSVEVTSLMAPGADPHLYQPTPRDAQRVARAKLVLVSGLGLEGWIEDLVRNAGGAARVVVVGQAVDPITHPDFPGGTDPHFWFDPVQWSAASRPVEEALVEIVGAERAEVVHVAADAYRDQLARLDAWSAANLETVPAAQRRLVTSHDAFNYLGRRYRMAVQGIVGISTESEASQSVVAATIDMIRASGVRAVFVETSVNPALIQRVARETGVSVAGPLYSDSLGVPEGPASTYTGMVSENVRMITEGLGGTYTPFPR